MMRLIVIVILTIFIQILMCLLIRKRINYVYKIYDNNLVRINNYSDWLIKNGKLNKYKNINLYTDTTYNFEYAALNLFKWKQDKFIKKWFRKELMEFENKLNKAGKK